MSGIDFNEKGDFVTLISKIQESTIFPKMFEPFPMGLYEVDDQDKILRVNKKFLEILKYENEEEIIGKHLNDFCVDKEKMKTFNIVVKEQTFARDILQLKGAKNQIIDVECFSQIINGAGNARWGMINDVTKHQRYYRALDRMLTGFFYVENGFLVQCNDYFARMHGFKNKEEPIGIETKSLFADENDWKRYVEELKESDDRGEALENFTFKIKRVNDGKILTVSIDAHMVKDSKGNVIGREGTVRDITEKKELEKRLEETAAETHKFINTLFHPAVKFAGKSKALYQVVNILHQKTQSVLPSIDNIIELGNELNHQLIQIRDKIREKDEIDPLLKTTLEEKLTKIINVFDYTLQTEEDKVILERKVRETALWVLEELIGVNYSRENKLKTIINQDFIEFLQGILFNYLKQNTEILMGEIEMMNRRVESIRTYISLDKQRKYLFARYDIKKILEENIQLFKPILLEKNIEIEPRFRGNLVAEISKQDIDRVISNLFLNVRNYSYKGEGRFVKVKARELQPQNQVEISIENFGLPIKKEEITSSNIFRFGYRGVFAYKSDRDGIGVGLADAMDVIQAHEGEIYITSKAVGDDGDPPQYKVPYLTKVTLIIPKTRNK